MHEVVEIYSSSILKTIVIMLVSGSCIRLPCAVEPCSGDGDPDVGRVPDGDKVAAGSN